MKKTEYYKLHDSQAGFRNKMSGMVDYILRGKEAAEKAVKDERNEYNTRQFLLGKIHAFDELLSFFDDYKVVEYELQTNKGFRLYKPGMVFLYDANEEWAERLPRKKMTPEEVIEYVNSLPERSSEDDEYDDED